ncbi:hypothetical protein RN346_04480 [Halomonas sp. PAMB 3232]|uniref:hypothetical protein n=1 Tax=Halomonas sp. PAMB 3232 TaxID=3075221 RepID=UPI00289736D3|nr:hypothetical protein [Halomonas sp. PAMB 3232]WNL39818.1 hypothetical protein RN346_04480 [Halomonas sp. PAMB 3232]
MNTPTPTFTRFDAVPVRGMNEREFDEAALSFFPKLVPFSSELNTAVEWMNQAVKAILAAGESAQEAALSAGLIKVMVESASSFKGQWSALTGSLSPPASVYHRAQYWRLLTHVSDVTASEPGQQRDIWIPATPAIAEMQAGEAGLAGDPLIKQPDGSVAFGSALRRYDLSSIEADTLLDLDASNVFRVDATLTPRTLSFANEPGANRAMVVVIHILGENAVTWPDYIQWDSREAPVLESEFTRVVMMWDGIEWTGNA